MAQAWTNNYQALKNIFLCGDAIPDLSCIKDTGGNIRSTVTDSLNYHDLGILATSPLAVVKTDDTVSGYLGYGLVRVGGGDTTPAITDYELTGILSNISYLSAVNDKPTWNANTGEVSNTIHLTVQNTAAEAQTIKEWGLYMRIPSYRGSASSYHYLVYHATLDAPVTVNPSQSVTLTLTRTVTLTDPVSWPE